MAKQSRKPADLNRLAAAIVGDATSEPRKESDSQPKGEREAASRAPGKTRQKAVKGR